MQWYVSQNGTTSGPFAEQRIAMLLNWGKISADAYVCDEQLCWVSIQRSPFAPLLAPTSSAPAPDAAALARADAQVDAASRESARAVLVLLAFLMSTLMVTALAALIRSQTPAVESTASGWPAAQATSADPTRVARPAPQ
jgi:hypothetical protein